MPNTRTWDLTAETRDLRMNHTRSIPSGLRFPFELLWRLINPALNSALNAVLYSVLQFVTS